MEAVEFPNSDPWTILPILAVMEQQIGRRVECIAIDEGQFVADLFLFTKRLLQSEYDVLVSGLELDFRGSPFGEMIQLSWLARTYAGNITELVAFCSCGAKALYPTGSLLKPHHHGRRLLRAPLRRALRPPRPPPLAK